VHDRHHLDHQSIVDDSIHDPILASTSGVQRRQRLAERLAEPVRVRRSAPTMNSKAAAATLAGRSSSSARRAVRVKTTSYGSLTRRADRGQPGSRAPPRRRRCHLRPDPRGPAESSRRRPVDSRCRPSRMVVFVSQPQGARCLMGDRRRRHDSSRRK